MIKPVYLALCDSEICAFKRVKVGTKLVKGKRYDRHENRFMGAIIKPVTKGVITCPDCQSALFWITEEGLKARDNTSHRKVI
jgi:hypothetical protein